MRAIARVVVPIGLLTLVVAGCSRDDAAVSPSPSPEQTITDSASSLAPTAEASTEQDHVSQIATSKTSTIDVYASPNDTEFETLDAADVLTAPEETPLVFLVKTDTDGWLQVWLPIRPNGSTGWVREDDVTVAETKYWIQVDLGGFNLEVYNDDDMVLETEIGVGQDELPTPGGTYFIRELLQPPDPSGAYGPFAYGLSGYSPVLDSFNGGDAVIGIHGTNEPSSIGGTVSHGCIRMSNDAITEIATEIGLPLGTPVYIDD